MALNKQLSVDMARIDAALAGTDSMALIALRAELVELKKDIESQLADDNASHREDRADMIARGMHPREADLRAAAEGDHDWRARAGKLQRIVDTQLGRIRTRLSVLSPSARPYSAVAIPGAGRSGELAARALNELVSRGCKIGGYAAVGADLVVMASEPTS